MSDRRNTANSGLGRRGEALAEAGRIRIVEAGSKQNRHVRRNNLRVARIEARVPASVRKEAMRRAVVRATHEAAGTAT